MTHPPFLCPELPPTHWRPFTVPRPRRGASQQERFPSKAFELSVNLAIEFAYKASFPNHSLLVGSDFDRLGPGATILAPKGAPAGANDLLNQLRGLVNQRRPDIIDFTDRRMYEIKSANSWNSDKDYDQLTSQVRLANEIRKHDAWDVGDWLPPHVMAYAADAKARICTGETDYSRYKGLIQYRVYVLKTKEEIEQRAAASAVMTELVPEMETSRDRLAGELNRVAPQFDEDADLWILCPSALWRAAVMKPRMDAKPLPQTIDLRKYPLMAQHAAMAQAFAQTAVIVLAATACVVVIAGSILLLPEVAAGAVAGTAAAASAGTAEGAAVISLEAYRAARTAAGAVATARQVSSVAAALLVVVFTDKASASVPTKVTDVSAIRAVSAEDVPMYYDYQLDREIVYLDQPYRIIGRARINR